MLFKDKKEIIQFVTKNVLTLISNREIINHCDKRLKTSFILDIIHTLLLKYFINHDNEFNLSSTILRKKYGNDYSFYIKYLLDTKIIILSSEYYVGSKTRTYALSEDTLKSDVTKISNTDKKLISDWKKTFLEKTFFNSKSNFIDDNIKQKLINDLFSISIDVDKAKLYLDSSNSESYNRNLYSILSINNNDLFYSFDDYGRLHTNFTILKGDIRKNCLKIDSLDIYELDIKNSQPLFLSILLSNNINLIKDKEEYYFFRKSVINGTLYSYFMDESGLQTKREVKELIYKVLFGKNKADNENKLFKSLFPNIWSFIVLYKKQNGDYRCLAYLLQRNESNLLFNDIIKNIILKYPHIKLFTIHDSICYPQIYRKEVEEVFYAQINKIFQNEKQGVY